MMRLAAAAVVALLSTSGIAGAVPSGAADASLPTVVLCHPDDRYRLLAMEIARREGIPLVDSLDEAFSARPTFLLWVVSPARLSDRVATSFNAALDRRPTRVSFGLITGSTVESARMLYERGKHPRPGPAFSVIGEDTFSRPHIVEFHDAARPQWTRLSGTSDVLARLDQGSYVHFAGHGGGGYWALWEGETLRTASIPRLPPLVISTMSCQTSRVWERDSIALRFVDQGAAAYSGFYYSPISGYHIGEEEGPFRYTWPDVPIGHVVQLVNEGALKSYARVAFHLLLGDPRLSLRPDPPCRFVDSVDAADARTLSCADAPPGMIPVRIPGGARYEFIDLGGRGSAWTGEAFFNRRLQTTVIGEDRFVLVEHDGGRLDLRLRDTPPPGWLAVHPLVDALDDHLVGSADRRHGGDLIAVAVAILALVPVTRRVWRGRVPWRAAGLSVALGLAAGILHAAYGTARQHELVIVTKPIVFSPLAAVGTGVLVAAGAVLFFTAGSWRGRVTAAVIATLVGWLGVIIRGGMSLVANVAIASTAGLDVWIYRMPGYPIVLAVVTGLVWLAYSAAARLGHATTSVR